MYYTIYWKIKCTCIRNSNLSKLYFNLKKYRNLMETTDTNENNKIKYIIRYQYFNRYLYYYFQRKRVNFVTKRQFVNFRDETVGKTFSNLW